MNLLNKNILRVLTLAGYLILICGSFALLAQLYVYLNTGADRSKILHVPITSTAPHQPIISWDTTQIAGRLMDATTLASIERDYFQAWHVRSLSLQLNDTAILNDYFTKSARKKYQELIAYNDLSEVHVISTTLSHAPQINLFSEDGQLVTFTDERVEEYREIYQNDTLISSETQIATYEVMMLLEDGHWRIRQMILKKSEEQTQLSLRNSSQFTNWDGINYYPQQTPWDTFGADFNIEVIEKDFKLIKKSGLNSIRIFLGYEDLGKEFVKTERLEKVIKLLDAAQAADLKVLITLFDFYGNYNVSDWTFTQKHALTIVKTLKEHAAVAGWDIKNEPDLDFESREKHRVKQWLSFMVRCVKKEDPVHPVTIGWFSIDQATHLSNEVDLISFHYYDNLEKLGTAYKSLSDSLSGRNLLLSEYGRSSHTGWWQFFKEGNIDQANYHEQIAEIIKAHDIPSMSWTLYDFEEIPEAVLGTSTYRQNLQKKYGFINENGKEKPSYKFISKR